MQAMAVYLASLQTFMSSCLMLLRLCVPCRPRLLFQYLPYSQQEPLQMSQLDIAALVEAVCGAAGASGVWGVSAAGDCLLCDSYHQSLQCHRLLHLGACASVALVLLGNSSFVLQAGKY